MTYSRPAKIFHWITAIAVISTVPMGITMMRVGSGDLQNALFFTHKSIGALILMVTAARLVWRLFHPAPPLVPGLPGWQVAAAKGSHLLLYVLLFAVPLLGWAGTSAFGAPVDFFGLFNLPQILEKDQALAERLLGIHAVVALSLAGLVLVHVSAALYHHFIRKDETLRRMI